MVRKVDTKEYLDMVCRLLDEGHRCVPVTVAGSSMSPFLHHGDTVYLDKLEREPRRADIVLYTRPGGRYILHRIVRVCPDGSLIMMGDAQTEEERIPSRDAIHAVVVKAKNKGRILTPGSLRWRFFATVWIWVAPARNMLVAAWTRIKRFGKK